MSRRLRDFLISERFVMAVILVNTVALTGAGFYPVGSPMHTLFEAIDYACVLFFVLEVILKVGALGWKGYISSGWNRFDFLVTAFCLPMLINPFVGTHLLGWAPIVRTGRLFRLFRLLRFIPDVDRLVAGVRRALRASVGVFLALLLVNLILALGANFLFAEESPAHFGDPGKSFYSIFRIFTIENWDDFPRKLEATREGWAWTLGTRVFFAFAVLICGMLGFSLANAVFIDEMMMDNNRLLERKVDALNDQVASLEEKLDILLAETRRDA